VPIPYLSGNHGRIAPIIIMQMIEDRYMIATTNTKSWWWLPFISESAEADESLYSLTSNLNDGRFATFEFEVNRFQPPNYKLSNNQ
jgi:hypothetical protein